MVFYIGTYTHLGGPGIAVCERDGDALRLIRTAELENPSYLILNAAKNRLYAVSEVGGGGAVAAYAVDGDALTSLGQQPATGAELCHLCLDEAKGFLYTAAYGTGVIEVFPVTPEGLGPAAPAARHRGRPGPHPSRQDGPHAHQVTRLPGTPWLCCVDLGLDQVRVCAADPRTGALEVISQLDAPPGYGPRHLAFGAPGRAYLAHELANRVSALRYNAAGRLHIAQTVSTLPEDFGGENTVAAIRVSPDGGTLWVSNRGHDSLAAYAIGENGLTLRGIYHTGDKNPRDFALIDAQTLLVAHQEGALGLYRFEGDALVRRAWLDIRGAVCVCLP
ncbi:MAG: lactonase family protein [Oscillospiraceae bacterium]|nr:lactonase family protein [Oscillospiraceae bacterium]